MMLQHACRLARRLPKAETVRSIVQGTKHQCTLRPISLSLCCSLIGAASCRNYVYLRLPRAACQESVVALKELGIADTEQDVHVERRESLKNLLIEQLRFWQRALRTLASNLVHWVLISLRYLRNSVLFGPLLVSYPLVILFPDTFQDLWLRALLRSVELSGPTFIKLGQWASTRRDLFQPAFCDKLSKLHRNAPSHSLAYTREALERAFGALWREVFRFETRGDNYEVGVKDKAFPVYSGCVGQVHRAYMRPDVYEAVMKGREDGLRDWSKCDPSSEDQEWIPVAVKVLHPGILETVHLDLQIMNLFARVLRLIPGLHWLSPVGLVQEFEALMKNQINLKLEAENLDRFHENFSQVPYVKIPQPIWPFVTSDVLVETFESGENMSSFISADDETTPGNGGLKKCLAQLGVDVLLKMVFVDNFVHADLHPGNILVQGSEEHLAQPRRRVLVLDLVDEFLVYSEEVPSPLRLVLLDTGITSQLRDRDFNNFYQVFTAIALSQGDVVAELFIQHASSNECKDIETFKADMSALIDKAHQQTLQLGMMQVGYLLGDLFSLLIHHKVKLDSNFASVILAIMVLEGLGRSLDPTLDILEAAKPILLGR